MSATGRREFFLSLLAPLHAKKQPLIRPPYAHNPSLFEKHCPTCDAPCADVCPEGIITINKTQGAHLNFSFNGCHFCPLCAEACPNDVLRPSENATIGARFLIDIQSCLGWNQTMCYACKDSCVHDAIEFFGLFRPEIIPDLCVGCGACLSKCPTQSISIHASQGERHA